MKAIKSRITRPLPLGATMKVADNSGAKLVRLVAVLGVQGVKRRLVSGGVGELVIVSVVKGKPELRNTLVKAVIVRQKKEFRRPNNTRVRFESNAVVILKDEKTGTPAGTMIKGVVAKEAAERWSGIAKVASSIV